VDRCFNVAIFIHFSQIIEGDFYHFLKKSFSVVERKVAASGFFSIGAPE